MSFNPPRKSTYGDELVDDNWSQKAGSLPPPSTAQPINYNQQPQQGVQLPTNQLNQNHNQAPTNAPLAGLPAITPEDMLFIRSWQHDSYIKRVLPFTALSFGAYFLYNKSKQLPNKFSRYLGISALCFVVGRFFYQGELRRRLAESNLDTPYIEGLRRGLGVTKIHSEFSSGVGGSGFGDHGNLPESSPSWNTTGYSSNESVDINAPLSSRLRQNNVQPPFGIPENSFGTPFGSENDSISEAPKQTTYEELRARNRGYAK